MERKRIKISLFTMTILIISMLATSAFAASWSANLKAWSMASEISTLVKQKTYSTYFLEVISVGGGYNSVEHWIEKPLGGNLSLHSITQVGNSSSPSSDAKIGDEVVLNVKNPVSIGYEITATGTWSPN